MPGENGALEEALRLLKLVVLPALQERVLDNCDDDTQGDFRGHEAQTQDAVLPAAKRRRRSQADPQPRPAQSTAISSGSEPGNALG